MHRKRMAATVFDLLAATVNALGGEHGYDTTVTAGTVLRSLINLSLMFPPCNSPTIPGHPGVSLPLIRHFLEECRKPNSPPGAAGR